MGIKRFYQTLHIVTFTEPADEFDINPHTEAKTSFKGLIQPVTVGKSFTNGKDTEFIPATLKTSTDTVIASGSLVEDTDGTRYRVGRSVGMPKGVTGVKPKRGQHCEYSLTYANEGL